MSLLTQLSNKIQYSVSQVINDPNAEAYAKEQAEQAEQDAEAAQRAKDAELQAQRGAAAAAQANKDAVNLNERSQFSMSKVIGNTASGILTVFKYLVLVALMLYSGHLAANEAIGYNAPFRLLSFFYGAAFFWYIIPKTIYEKYWLKKEFVYHGLLPLYSSTPPDGFFENMFYGPFYYSQNNATVAAKSLVGELYEKGFKGVASPVASPIASPIASVMPKVSMDSVMPKVPSIESVKPKVPSIEAVMPKVPSIESVMPKVPKLPHLASPVAVASPAPIASLSPVPKN